MTPLCSSTLLAQCCLIAIWNALRPPRFLQSMKHALLQHAGWSKQALLNQALAEGSLRTQDLVSRGCIEYVDCEEEETTMIAMEIKDLDRATDGHIA